MAPVGYGDDGRDHLVLASRQRQVGRHQLPERRERVEQHLREERVRPDDALVRLELRVGRLGVLDGIEMLLGLAGLVCTRRRRA